MKCYTLNSTCRGESHKTSGKPCQDYSYSWNDGLNAIAIVSDGHGSDSYFRSATGARLAVEITADALRTFIGETNPEVFCDAPFTAMKALKQWSGDGVFEQGLGMVRTIDELFRALFSHILYKWRESIEQDAKNTAINDWEKEHVEQKYLDKLFSEGTKEKIYGCTLMAFARTENYWLAFQIGDGKCLSFRSDALGEEPIPWDDDCFLNKTTSLCDSNPLDRFRYCYQGDGGFPAAVFLGSDGLDDSYPEARLVNYYINLSKRAMREGPDALKNHLDNSLPDISEKGSKDDMSVACVYDGDALSELMPELYEKQVELQEAIDREKLEQKQQETDRLRNKCEKLEEARKDVEEARMALESQLQQKQTEYDNLLEDCRQLRDSLKNSEKTFVELNAKLSVIVPPLEQCLKRVQEIGNDSERQAGGIRQVISKIAIWFKN